MFEGLFAPSHLIIVAIVIVALFGYNKLPDVTRSVGRSLRIFKTEMKGLHEDDKVREDAETQGQATAAPAVTPVPVAPAVEAAPPAPVAPPTVDAAPSDDDIARAQAVLAAAAKARAEESVHVGAVAPGRADTAAH